jgi:hypothetical protein
MLLSCHRRYVPFIWKFLKGMELSNHGAVPRESSLLSLSWEAKKKKKRKKNQVFKNPKGVFT